jgi:hypothetical protein
MPRYTMDFGDKFDDLVAKLAQDKGITKAELIRRAVATYNYLTNETQDNKKGLKVSLSDQENKVLKDVILP